MLADIEAEEVSVDSEETLLERLGALDLLLTWLWKVHGIDYYGGKELLLETEYLDRAAAARTIRGPRPEEGEEQDENEGEGHAAGWTQAGAIQPWAQGGCNALGCSACLNPLCLLQGS